MWSVRKTRKCEMSKQVHGERLLKEMRSKTKTKREEESKEGGYWVRLF